MLWVTGRRAGLDALACAWLIRRFIDSDAVVLFAAGGKINEAVSRGFTPFCVGNTPLRARDECTSFAGIMERFKLVSQPFFLSGNS